MNKDDVKQLRSFLTDLTDFYFLLKPIGIFNHQAASDFIASHQEEEEQVVEHFLTRLIKQSMFFPTSPNKWVLMAKLCDYDHPAIIDARLDITEGGPINDWYIYPKLLKWLHNNAPNPYPITYLIDSIGTCFADSWEDFTSYPALKPTGFGFVRTHCEFVEAAFRYDCITSCATT